MANRNEILRELQLLTNSNVYVPWGTSKPLYYLDVSLMHLDVHNSKKEIFEHETESFPLRSLLMYVIESKLKRTFPFLEPSLTFEGRSGKRFCLHGNYEVPTTIKGGEIVATDSFNDQQSVTIAKAFLNLAKEYFLAYCQYFEVDNEAETIFPWEQIAIIHLPHDTQKEKSIMIRPSDYSKFLFVTEDRLIKQIKKLGYDYVTAEDENISMLSAYDLIKDKDSNLYISPVYMTQSISSYITIRGCMVLNVI